MNKFNGSLCRCLSLVLITCIAAGISCYSAAAAEKLNDAVLQQISALRAFKESLPASAKKIDSQLTFALKKSRNQPIDGVPQLTFDVKFEAKNMLKVDIDGNITGALLTLITANGGKIISSTPQFHTARVLISLNQVEALAGSDDVKFIRPAVQAMTQTGSVNSQGDVAHSADTGRSTFDLDGLGVKVGVLSDSVDFLANSQVLGDLPPDVVILPGQSGVPGSGEGTAMLEIVHDLAPGATLYFASAFNGPGSFAQNILDLRAAGCDVIIDDVGYFNESPFQDGLIARAVNSVAADGALYFSSAANSGSKDHNTSGTWEGDFADGGAAGAPVNGKGGVLHSFGAQSYNVCNRPGTATVLFWADPLGASTNDYDLYVLDSTGANVVRSSINIQDGTQDPYEIVSSPKIGERLVIVKASGDPRYLHMDTIRGRLSINTEGNTKGHSAAVGAFSVAAVNAGTSFPNPFSGGAGNPVESFSSDGPRRVFFNADGSAITPGNFSSTGGAVRAKPDIAAADGVSTTLPANSGLNPFFGTSAAAPHAGAIAALLKSYDPSLTASQIRSAFASTALDIEAPGADRDSGIGIVMGLPTLQFLPTPFPQPNLLIHTNFLFGGNGNGLIDFNECNALNIVLTNSGQADATGVQAILTTTTPGVIVAQGVSIFPDIPIGGTGGNLTPYRVSTTPGFVCGTTVDFALAIKSDQQNRTNHFSYQTGTLGLPIGFTNSTAFPIPDNSLVGTSSPMVVSNITSSIGKVTVSLYLTHTFDFDLNIELIAPDGTIVTLSQGNGGSGDNFGANCSPNTLRTTFDDEAFIPIAAASAPFVGSFQPDQPLSALNLKTGTQVNGIWRLHVVDQVPVDVGTLQCWSLYLTPMDCTDGGGECPGSDLSIGMTAAPVPAIAGTNLVYTMIVSNAGPSGAKSVVMSQNLPPRVTFVSATNSQGSVGYSGGAVTCNFGSIAAQQTATVSVTVIPSAAGTISSTATVNSEQFDPDLSNNTVTLLTRVVPPSADLAVTVSDLPDPVSVGGDLTYTVMVTNRGPTAATDVVLTNTLPSTAVFVSAVATQGTTINAGGTIINHIGSLPSGGGAVVTIVVRPSVVGTITETSRVVANEADLFPANNQAGATTTVSPAADLALSIVDSPDPVVTDSNITYVITITNSGPNPATGVVVNGTLPTTATFITNTISQGSFLLNGSSFIASLNSMAAESSAVITVSMAAPGTPQTIGFNATVLASQADPNSTNNSASVTSVVARPFVSIVQAGSMLTSESIVPANGSVDSGETVSVVLRLRNAGNISTTNLVATLLSGNGVTSLSAPQTYGALAPDGIAASKTFSFTANGGSGEIVTATLQLQDGATALTNVAFTFQLPTLTTFANTNFITIPDNGPASPYPSQITVSNVTGLVGNVSVTLDKINHTFPDDVDVLLVDPSGRKVLLMADAGGGNQLAGVSLTFDATASSAVADDDQLVSGSFVPADYAPEDFFTNAPAGSYETALDLFDGTTPNGTWSLYVVDDSVGDEGNIAGGWSLSFTTLAPVNQIAGLNIEVVDSPTAVLLNGNASYTFAVSNNGPDVANDVIVNNPLPPNCTAITPTTFNLGTLDVGSSTNVMVTLIPGAVGMLTNTATVSASEIDLNGVNNSASAVTAVGLPVSDLGISVSAPTNPIVGRSITYTISVTNNGPDSALVVVVTNRLPAGMNFVSATATQGTCANSAGVVTCALGNVGPNNSVTISIVATPSAAGLATNSANVVTASHDPNLANNSANIVSTVANPSANVVASGSHLISESGLANGVIDPGESVQIAFALANIGTADTANMVATLQASGGVTGSSSQTYGVLVHDGAAVSKTFGFSVDATNNGSVTATLLLNDGAKDLGSAHFTFDLPKLGSFANNAPISIPNSGPATPYPSTITITNATGLVGKVVVTLNGLTHSFPDDLDVLLVSPDGQKVLLMSDVGGAHGVSGVNLTFDDSGAALFDAAQIVSGTNSPTDLEFGESLPSAPARPYNSSLTAFAGGNPNGVWKLYINDDNGGDSGNVSGGWSLNLTTVNTINPAANLALSISAPASAASGDPMNYTITVSNQGPATASDVTLTDTLPSNFTFNSALPSQGSYIFGAGVVTCNLGSLNSGDVATVTLTGTPTSLGTITNSASATANETDLYLVNNTVQAITSVATIAPSTLGSATVMSDGNFQLTLTGQSGCTYRIDASSDLITWIPVKTNIAAVNGKFQFTDGAATNFNPRFYRAVRLP